MLIPGALAALHDSLAAVCPITSVIRDAQGVTKIAFADGATPEQRAAAQAMLDGYDWSPEAHEARAKDARAKAATDPEKTDVIMAEELLREMGRSDEQITEFHERVRAGRWGKPTEWRTASRCLAARQPTKNNPST